MKIRTFKDRFEVPNNDSLVHKEDLLNSLGVLKKHWAIMSQEIKKSGANPIGFSNCAEQIEHLIQEINPTVEESVEEELYQCNICRATDVRDDLEEHGVGCGFHCNNCLDGTMSLKR